MPGTATGTAILERVIALAQRERRDAAALALGAALGGDRVIVFVRDAAVGALLPAPGFPQTLPNARVWRRFLHRCVAEGEGCTHALSLLGREPVPAYGFSCTADIVAVVLGTDVRAAEVTELRTLLPLLAATFRMERAAAHAETQARLAGEAALRAEALAHALDGARSQIQRAYADAEQARHALELVNSQLQHQAVALEVQAEELELHTQELQQANAALEAAHRTSEAANRAKSEFLAMMSHELRTPLNAIGGYLQLIQMEVHGPVTDAQHEALGRIDRNQRRLLGLINDILNLARIEAGRVEYRIVDLQLAAAMADMQPMIEPQIRAKRLRYDVRIPEPSPLVRADAEKLQQILLNLLSNAVKFTNPGGVITVDCVVSDDASEPVTVRVTDSGIGIPAEKLGVIFEPFVQVDSSHSRLANGTGLGLAISKDLAEGMGGALTVTSAPGQGSAFLLRLPRG